MYVHDGLNTWLIDCHQHCIRVDNDSKNLTDKWGFWKGELLWSPYMRAVMEYCLLQKYPPRVEVGIPASQWSYRLKNLMFLWNQQCDDDMYFISSHIVANDHLPIFHDTSCRQRYHAPTVLCHCILTLANDKPTGHVITKNVHVYTFVHQKVCKDLFVQIKNKVLKWTQPDIHGYPTPYGKWIHPGWYNESNSNPVKSSRVVRWFIAGATAMLIRWLQIHVQWAKPASHFINQVASVSCQWNHQKYPPQN